MSKAEQRRRILKYWFFHPEKPLTESLMKFGLEVGDGWLDLIEELCKKLDNLIRTKYPDYMNGESPFEVLQVKEKFGGLRFYTNYTNDEIEDLIREYQNKSYTVCERCGSPGKLREISAWLLTLCDECCREILKEREEAK